MNRISEINLVVFGVFALVILPQHLKIRSWLNLLCCCVLGTVIAFTNPLIANAAIEDASVDTLKQQQEQLKQDTKSAAEEQKRLGNLQQAAQERLTGLQENLKTTGNQITDSENRLKLAIQRLEELEVALNKAENSYSQKQAATVARLRYLQRAQTSQGWAVLLQSQNLNEFLSRRRQLKLVYAGDRTILAKLTQQSNLLSQQKTEVEQQKNEIALIRQQLFIQKADYQTQAQSQQELIQRLNNDRFALAAAQTQLEQDSENIKRLIQQKVIAAERAKASSRYGFSGKGILAFPSDAPTSSPFGWRVHPILGYRRFHSGLDFAASYGATIRAADSGTVIFAGWYGGYGKTAIVSHGGGITTLYAHSSELYVAEGQTVERGQAIAAVGSTGLSTGPHLHFEVRENGSPVDPANYL